MSFVVLRFVLTRRAKCGVVPADLLGRCWELLTLNCNFKVSVSFMFSSVEIRQSFCFLTGWQVELQLLVIAHHRSGILLLYM